jgi:ABC-2 type transport system ATP-binding protein
MRPARLEARIDELMVRMDLTDAANRPLRTYSKGMLQRAGLAQALVHEPDLVFLDEPTSGLDPLGRVLVRGIIEELRSRGTTVFLNSHLLGEVEATCDRVVFVKHGRVVHELSLGDSPAGVDVELRIGRTDPQVLEGLSSFGTADVDAEQALPEIARWIVARGVALYELRSRRKSLEEWFVEVMGEDQRPG